MFEALPDTTDGVYTYDAVLLKTPPENAED
jgi:hypothetical protein